MSSPKEKDAARLAREKEEQEALKRLAEEEAIYEMDPPLENETAPPEGAADVSTA